MIDTTTTSRTELRSGVREHVLPAFFAAALGLVIVFASGFAPSEVVHNAAHDGRHSFAFPCH